MQEPKHFLMAWPELDVSVECEPLAINRSIYDWWIERMPLRAVQSHALVTGPLIYCLCVWLPERALALGADEVTTMQMVDAPPGYGTLGYSERGGFGGGLIGGLEVTYGQLTEDMPCVYSFKVVDDDIKTLVNAGRRIWESVYKTNELITVEVSVIQ